MLPVTYSVKITLASILIKDAPDGGPFYFIGKIGPHSTGRSKTFKGGKNTVVDLSSLNWAKEFLVNAAATIPVEFEAFDENLIWDDTLGKLSFTIGHPWEVKEYSTDAASGKYTLNWTLASVTVIPSMTSVVVVSRQVDGSVYASALAAPVVAVAQITDIQGLYKPGVDDRTVKPPGTTKNASYVAGYTSNDNKGRIYTNRKPDGTWTRDTQFIEITAQVGPTGLVIPAGATMVWSFEDPDDPSDDDPKVRVDAGRILDPNDYTGLVKNAPVGNDNDPNGKANETPKWEEVDPKYALAGNETLIDVPTRTTKVRFHVSDVAGDNYKVTCAVKPSGAITTSIPSETGIMTVWHRVDLEYVKMASATELPVDQISKFYDKGCVQVDVSLKRTVSGASKNRASMGTSDAAAYARCKSYVTKATGQFTKEGTKGWFFVAAANRYLPAKATSILYEGNAEAHGDRVRLPMGTVLAGSPAVVRVFNAAKIGAMAPPKPNDYDIHIKFKTPARLGDDLVIEPHDYYPPEDPFTPFLLADLSHYGFAAGTVIPIQVMSRGDEALVTGGISPPRTVGGVEYFAGKLLVFTKSLDSHDLIGVLDHEFCHAFDNAHKCGNWNWVAQPDKTACCMNYWFQFVLDDSAPRKPIVWTQNRLSPELCAPHLRRMRDYHLEDNLGLGW